MKTIKMNRKFYIWLFCVVVAINICWQLLEILIYGEIQPRIVDDIICILWIFAVCFAYKFENIELKRMFKKYKEVQTNNQWWMRKPIPTEILKTGYISDKIWLQSEHEIGAHNKGGFTTT